MSTLEHIFLNLNKTTAEILSGIPKECQETFEWLENYGQELQSKIQQSEKFNKPIYPKTPIKRTRKAKRVLSSSSENEESSKVENKSSNNTDNTILISEKPKRNASKRAEEKINAQAHMKLNSKLRRPAKGDIALNDISNNMSLLKLKTEKISPAKSLPVVTVKEENVTKEDMPPPRPKPKKIRKKIIKKEDDTDTENEAPMRITRSKKIVKNSESGKSTASTKKRSKKRGDDSDVILQEIPIPVVVVDSDTDEISNPKDSEQFEKDSVNKPLNNTMILSKDVGNSLNVTHVIEKSTPVNQTKSTSQENDVRKEIDMNCTVVLEKMNTTMILEKKKDTPNATSKLPIISNKTPGIKSPFTNNKLQIPQTDSKAYRKRTVNKTSTLAVTKSQSAAKPSRADLQLRREEEQKKRLEKEEEAKRKREAIMQAKAEEQRKKREEKQMKAQKAREDIEREKEEKLRQILQEKEEESQRKKLIAKKQAEMEEKRKIEELKLTKIREYERQKQLEDKRQKQLATKAPPLPTNDCEDSDSSSENVKMKKQPYEKPEWAQSANLHRSLLVQKFIPKLCIEKLFKMEATTPDLREIFETIDERVLRRNSSAVWFTPPRYSTLPKF